MRSDAFRDAVDARDLDATMATLSPAVILRSPVRDEPLQGKAAVRRLFAILFDVFVDLRFVGAYSSPEDGDVLHFVWRVRGRDGEGVDMLHFDADGLIDDYRVMVRPLSAVEALRDAAFAQLPEA
jgi:ketosteroid isomerase-like protein